MKIPYNTNEATVKGNYKPRHKQRYTVPLSGDVHRAASIKDDRSLAVAHIDSWYTEIPCTLQNLMHERHVITSVHGIDAALNYVH